MSSAHLTSRERFLRAIHREPTDCVAVAPYMYDIAAVFADVPLYDFCTSGEAMARAQLALQADVGQDVIAVGSDNFYIAEGLGCQTTEAGKGGEVPALVVPAAESFAAAAKLKVPDPFVDGRMPVMLDAIRRVRRAVGDTVAIRSPGTGPFALASYLVGTQEWLCEVGMIEAGLSTENEQFVHQILDLTAEALIRFGNACADAGADILHCGDSLASCDMISPATYRKYALPYEQKVFQGWKAHGPTASLLHICGNSTRVLDAYADAGASVVEIDNQVDLAVAKSQIGERVAIMGNVHTVTDLQQGTPESVRLAAQKCIQQASRGGGYILGSGCIVPRKTPVENVREMVRVARESCYKF